MLRLISISVLVSKEEEFEGLKIKWKDLLLQGKAKEADEFYREKLFPPVQEEFVLRVKKMKDDGEVLGYDVLIIPLSFSYEFSVMLVNALKPKVTYFICTKEVIENVLDKVVQLTNLSPSQYEKDFIKYEGMDLAEVYQKIKGRLDLFRGKKIAVDLSRGKRVMTAAAAIVGDFFGCDLLYIDTKWMEDFRRGEPGTEILVKVDNPLSLFGDLEKQHANLLFNNSEFEAAHKLFDIIREKVSDPRDFEVKSLLSQSYAFWDTLNYGQAYYLLKRAAERISLYNISEINSNHIKLNLESLKILERATGLGFLELLKDENLTMHLLIDILSNALRRAEQNRYEDAILRFYRAIELVSQHRLAKFDIDTKSVDAGKLKDYEKKFSEINESFYGQGKSIPKQTALMDGHILLFCMQDEPWKGKTADDLREILECTQLRDNSIVAHGIKLIDKTTYEKFRKVLMKMILSLCKLYNKNFDELLGMHSFLKLK